MGKMPITAEDTACLNKKMVFAAFLGIEWESHVL
jgi:hypothetical protein